jgi:hypothetical protein
VRAVQLVGNGGFLEAVGDDAEPEALQQLVGIRMVLFDLAVEGVVPRRTLDWPMLPAERRPPI